MHVHHTDALNKFAILPEMERSSNLFKMHRHGDTSDRSLILSISSEEFLASASHQSHQLVLITSLPFVHTPIAPIPND